MALATQDQIALTVYNKHYSSRPLDAITIRKYAQAYPIDPANIRIAEFIKAAGDEKIINQETRNDKVNSLKRFFVNYIADRNDLSINMRTQYTNQVKEIANQLLIAQVEDIGRVNKISKDVLDYVYSNLLIYAVLKNKIAKMKN